MTISLLQPSVFPNLQHLAMLKHSERACWCVWERFSRKGMVHRGQIRTPQGTQWLTLPVHPEDKKKPLNKVRLSKDTDWVPTFLTALHLSYRNSVYYDFYEAEIEADFNEASRSDFLLDAVLFLSNKLFLYTEWPIKPTLLTSEPETKKIIDQIKPDSILMEPGSRYYRPDYPKREEADFRLPVYRQHFDGFEPNCCLLDVLFQYGPESYQVCDAL